MSLPAIGLRGRLAISIALIIVSALAITYVAVYRGTGADLRQQTDDDLARQVASLEAGLATPPPVGPEAYASRARQLIATQGLGPSATLMAVTIDGVGTVTNQPELLGTGTGGSVTPGPPPLPESEGRDGEREDSDHDREGREPWEHDEDDFGSARDVLRSGDGYSTIEIEEAGDVRLLTRETILPGGTGATIRVGQPLESVERALEGLSRTFLIVGLFALVIAIAAGWVLASRTAKPIRELAEVAETVDDGGLSARMDVSHTRNDEVRRLAESFNLMLDRLESAFTRQRAFVADASHDLRTPLTVVSGQLEVLSRNPDPSPEEVRRVSGLVRSATERMERLVEDLLMLARSDSPAEMQLERGDLQPLLAAEVESFSDSEGAGVELGDVSDVQVAVDRERLARAVSNLISNAVTHAGPDGSVRVSAERSGDGLAILVDDDGPGVPPGDREKIFDRFARLDSARSSDRGGSGLGLAIVKAVAEAHGGTASCAGSPLGGARFRIWLPPAPPA